MMGKAGVFALLALAALLSAAFLCGCAQSQPSGETQLPHARIIFEHANVSIDAEIADTPESMETGLMFRTSLPEKSGMIFYFNQSAYNSFWMLNTKIPLEAIFLDENFTVVDIIEMDPCNDAGTPTRMPNCTIYLPRWPSRYTIEVNQNFSDRYGITGGETVRVLSQQAP